MGAVRLFIFLAPPPRTARRSGLFLREPWSSFDFGRAHSWIYLSHLRSRWAPLSRTFARAPREGLVPLPTPFFLAGVSLCHGSAPPLSSRFSNRPSSRSFDPSLTLLQRDSVRPLNVLRPELLVSNPFSIFLSGNNPQATFDPFSFFPVCKLLEILRLFTLIPLLSLRRRKPFSLVLRGRGRLPGFRPLSIFRGRCFLCSPAFRLDRNIR